MKRELPKTTLKPLALTDTLSIEARRIRIAAERRKAIVATLDPKAIAAGIIRGRG